MSTSSSVRRLKERGGATVAKPSKPITPISEKSIKICTGKENPSRPTSRLRAAVSHKPAVVRPMQRIDKSSPCFGESVEPRARWSTSSVPRGRSSSPSEFNRVLSDLRKARVSKGPVEKCEKGGNVEIDRVQPKKGSFRDSNVKLSENGIRASMETKDSVRIVAGLEKSSELCKELEPKPSRIQNSKDTLLAKNIQEDINLSSISLKSGSECNLDSEVKALDNVKVFEKLKSKSCVGFRSSYVIEKKESGGYLSLKASAGKSLNRLSGSENLKEKGTSEDSVGGRTINKYPSKLHEKLAFLEGKVKRIASNIKRTKEMLDMNNPDASKMILFDIQETVAGMEKAMSHVVNSDDGKMGLAKTNENDSVQAKDMIEKSPIRQAKDTKSSVKRLNTEELEVRLFPHHKLLRDRTALKTSSVIHKSQEPEIEESTTERKQEEKSLSPIDDENLIAMEFLASLGKEQSKVTTRGEDANLEFLEVQEMEGTVNTVADDSSNAFNGKGNAKTMLTTDETLKEFDDQENAADVKIEEEPDDSCTDQFNEIGGKTSIGGWFVSEGESVLLTHDDGSCSLYDIANSEEKSIYKPPVGISANMWRDCWIIRAPGPDGCSGRYVVAASAGNSTDSGFCSWDFYTKAVKVCHVEDAVTNTRTALAPLPNNPLYRRNALSNLSPENQQWWYKPCGPLIVSTASCQRVVSIYDIRDGEHIMKWEVQNPVSALEYSSPLQWRNRGKVVLAEAENVSVWDVASLNARALLSVSSSGRKISALHVNNTDAELGGGVRQRVSSSEAEGNDGVFCTLDSIKVLDFRHPSGIGLMIPKFGTSAQSVFPRGDSIYVGCTSSLSATKRQSSPSLIQQFSLRKQKLFTTYTLPESNAHSHFTALTQVWGNSNLVMGVCGLGLFVFDALKDDHMLQAFNTDHAHARKAREVFGPDDLYSPSFDYLGSRALLISRDRPAMWRYLS